VNASNKLTAELENIQANSHALNKTGTGRLKMKAATRWNSLEAMLKSHIENVEGICQVIEAYPERDISDETTLQCFIKKVKKHLPYLSHIKSASVSMQKKLATLEECQFLCDLVATCAKDGKGKAGNDFSTASKKFLCLVTMFYGYLCSHLNIIALLFFNDRIEADKFKVVNKYDADENYICAVLKVQLGQEELLSYDEEAAIASWKLDQESEHDTLDNSMSEFDLLKQA
jgi:hypothetical protein